MSATFKKTNLFKQAMACDYDVKSFDALFSAIQEKIRAYDPDHKFGKFLDEHLQDVRTEVTEFLIFLGQGKKIATIIGDAAAWHDFGKTLQSPVYWRITEEKREKTAIEKIERPKHTTLGVIAVDETIEKTKFNPTQEQSKFIDIAKLIILYHHEREDGTGPHGLKVSDIDESGILQAIIAVDTFKGKMKTEKTNDQIYADMTGDKHLGHLHGLTVEAYGRFLISKGLLSSTPTALALTPVS